jgi:hypothetical protein
VLALCAACWPAPADEVDSGNAGPVIAAVTAADAAYTIGGYTSKVSVAQAESIDFHVSNPTPASGEIRVYRQGTTLQLMTTIGNVYAGAYSCDGKYTEGCGWPAAASLTVPPDWPSGAYIAQIVTVNGARNMIFWVREDDPGSTARLLFLSSVNTHQAYNDYGGGSLYGFPPTALAQKVSFNRPYTSGVGKFQMWEQKAIPWLESNGYAVEYATTYDLEFHPDLMSHYDVVMVAGHSEYWTWGARHQVDEFVKNGGRFINLSGNTMWWQIRYEDDGRTLVVYKNWNNDPLKSSQDATDNPGDYPILDSPLAITGLYWPYGGYPGGDGDGYYAVHTDHWIFEGTGVTENQLIGKGPTKETSIHDKESDGMPFNCAADGSTILGAPGYSGIDNFTVLGLTTVYSKQRDLDIFTMMGIYTRPGGGALFTAGATGWARALNDPVVAQMTRNVLDRFLAGDVPAEPHNPDTDYFVYDRFNCYDVGRDRFTSTLWKADIARNNFARSKGAALIDLKPSCGYQGSGLEVKMGSAANAWFTLNLRPNWATTDTLYSHFYLKLTDLALGEGKVINLMQQSHDDLTDEPPASLRLQGRRQGGELQLRYQPTTANLPWVTVPSDRFFLVETGVDRQTGRVALWIDGAGYDETLDLASIPALNRFDVGFIMPPSGLTGYYCVDELILDDERFDGLPDLTPTPTATAPATDTPTPTATATPTVEPTPTVAPVTEWLVYISHVSR